ncbi:PotD/PotF family extracellular solute-binding protein [Paracraurococcus sp. LOR1-02]|uniref:PotD/PotF family extracellular solute-binding protein n=2 Tax=Paracraurococcus lichenis TaxID=3064888 RepID=A0ABT9EB45_9PROT|nr:PotD/PotF family extracellular solute-binding protein [Paracraurococcus sp. LOR1-02]MDO9713432.1 PotD/PotF family extracellular solute-binding protein [Paracraurococcus sp. LOR1-02]
MSTLHVPPTGATRRSVLKAALGTTGIAAGSGALTGFPTIWAQNIKDITLQHAGPPVTAIGQIAEQASKDLGFTVRMQASENADLLNRFLSQSNAIDVADVSITFMKYLVGRNVLQGIPLSKIRHWEQTIPLFTKGEYPDGRRASLQGVAPYSVLYVTSPEVKAFSDGPSEWLTGIPAVTNADTLGIRPDLVGRPVTSWADLLDPAFKGKSALQDQPTVGVIDVALAVEARGAMTYGNKGNMTRAEIDKTIALMMEVKRSGQFRSFWTTFDQSVNLMASGEVVIQSMWSPAVSAVRTRGIPCVFQPLKEGYRGWGYNLGMMKHLTGLKRDCAIEYANWYGSGFQGAFIARQGYYSAQPETARKFLTAAEWDYWYGGKPAATDLSDPFGKPAIKAGEVRDGGAFWQRMGNIAVWNSVMDEDRYLTRRWNEFISS